MQYGLLSAEDNPHLAEVFGIYHLSIHPNILLEDICSVKGMPAMYVF